MRAQHRFPRLIWCTFPTDSPVPRAAASIEITYPGTGNETALTYDGLGRCVKIVETGSTPAYNGNATKQLIWCEMQQCEERDDTGAVVKQFFQRGQRNGSSRYFYSRDHLGSVRALTDNSAVIQAQYTFSPYGERTVLSEAVPADFAFTGHYLHSRSGLTMALFRAYSPVLGKWISRDPKGESGGVNLYAYVGNNPVNVVDLLGLSGTAAPTAPTAPTAPPTAPAGPTTGGRFVPMGARAAMAVLIAALLGILIKAGLDNVEAPASILPDPGTSGSECEWSCGENLRKLRPEIEKCIGRKLREEEILKMLIDCMSDCPDGGGGGIPLIPFPWRGRPNRGLVG